MHHSLCVQYIPKRRPHRQAGVNQSVFARQTEVLCSPEGAAQLLAYHAHGHAQVPPLHLPGGTQNTGWRTGPPPEGSRNILPSADTHLIFPVRIFPAYCIPVRAMYIRRISLVP